MLPEDPEVCPTSGYIREPPESPSGPETVRYEREAGGTVYTWETVHARHSGLVWLTQAVVKSRSRSYVATTV
jgi:hypothetical protein